MGWYLIIDDEFYEDYHPHNVLINNVTHWAELLEDPIDD
jgi:hypothetical protein